MIRYALAALSVAAGFGLAAIAAEDQLTDEAVVGAMCPTHRPAGLTYGGLTPMPGYERDHWVPLCLGGLDTRIGCHRQPYSAPNSALAALDCNVLTGNCVEAVIAAPEPATCNVWYEPYPEYVDKNTAEHNACRLVCHAGPAAIEAAREDFRRGNWRKWLEP